jgi:hypothetical protein
LPSARSALVVSLAACKGVMTRVNVATQYELDLPGLLCFPGRLEEPPVPGLCGGGGDAAGLPPAVAAHCPMALLLWSGRHSVHVVTRGRLLHAGAPACRLHQPRPAAPPRSPARENPRGHDQRPDQLRSAQAPPSPDHRTHPPQPHLTGHRGRSDHRPVPHPPDPAASSPAWPSSPAPARPLTHTAAPGRPRLQGRHHRPRPTGVTCRLTTLTDHRSPISGINRNTRRNLTRSSKSPQGKITYRHPHDPGTTPAAHPGEQTGHPVINSHHAGMPETLGKVNRFLVMFTLLGSGVHPECAVRATRLGVNRSTIRARGSS